MQRCSEIERERERDGDRGRAKGRDRRRQTETERQREGTVVEVGHVDEVAAALRLGGAGALGVVRLVAAAGGVVLEVGPAPPAPPV